jgi:predicted dienelactone hydrolase
MIKTSWLFLVLLLLFACLSMSQSHIAIGLTCSNPLLINNEGIELPKPAGAYAVGTVIYNWTDVNRDDLVSEAPDDKRQLIVQIWYPAEAEGGMQKAPYMPELAVLRSAFKQGAEQLERIRTNSLLQAKLSRARSKYPAVVFSHGMGTPRSFYTSMMEELASQGYVVAGIDHPYMGLVAINGHVVRPYARWTEPPPGGLANKSDEERDQYWRVPNEQLSADQRFVLDQLERLNMHDPDNRFTHQLDLKRVGMMGHSQGFVSQTCGTDERFKACLKLDGVPAMTERRNGLRQPYLTMRDGDDSPRATTIYERLRNVGYDILINGAGHNSYLDRPLAAAYKYKLDAVRAHRIVNAYMLAFFDTYLKGKKSQLLERSSPDFPDVEFAIYKATHKKL